MVLKVQKLNTPTPDVYPDVEIIVVYEDYVPRIKNDKV